MPNYLDRIIKENIEPLFTFFAEKLGIKIEQSEEIKDKLQITLEREADFLRKIFIPKQKKGFIFHLEFQTKMGHRLKHRILLYRAILFHKFDLPVKQTVIFLGKNPIKATNFIEQENLSYRFHIINICEIPYQDFIKTNAPEAIVMAILGDTQNQTPQKVIDDVMIALKNNTIDEIELRKFLAQLQVISNLRNLQSEILKIIEIMPLTIDLSKDPLIKRLTEAATLTSIQKMLASGILTIEQIADFTNTTPAFVLKVQKEMNDTNQKPKKK